MRRSTRVLTVKLGEPFTIEEWEDVVLTEVDHRRQSGTFLTFYLLTSPASPETTPPAEESEDE